jgi:uncharacterized protein with HEPN domain
MRNILVHGYDIVAADVLWDVAATDIPKLRTAILALSSPAAAEVKEEEQEQNL